MQLTNIVVVIVLESKWAIKFVDFESNRRRGKTTKSDCNKSAASATERVGCCRARNDKIINERECVVGDNEIIKANKREKSYHNKFLAFSSRIHELIRQLSSNHFPWSLSHFRVAPHRQMLKFIFRIGDGTEWNFISADERFELLKLFSIDSSAGTGTWLSSFVRWKL